MHYDGVADRPILWWALRMAQKMRLDVLLSKCLSCRLGSRRIESIYHVTITNSWGDFRSLGVMMMSRKGLNTWLIHTLTVALMTDAPSALADRSRKGTDCEAIPEQRDTGFQLGCSVRFGC